jgi:hypothetical protein
MIPLYGKTRNSSDASEVIAGNNGLACKVPFFQEQNCQSIRYYS